MKTKTQQTTGICRGCGTTDIDADRDLCSRCITEGRISARRRAIHDDRRRGGDHIDPDDYLPPVA